MKKSLVTRVHVVGVQKKTVAGTRERCSNKCANRDFAVYYSPKSQEEGSRTELLDLKNYYDRTARLHHLVHNSQNHYYFKERNRFYFCKLGHNYHKKEKKNFLVTVVVVIKKEGAKIPILCELCILHVSLIDC